VRVLGSRHSFNDVADSDELVSLDGLPAEVVFDHAAGTVTVAAALVDGLFCAVTPVDDAAPVVAGPEAAAPATLAGTDPPPGATAQAWPEVAALAALSWTVVLDDELTVTGASLAPPTCTAARAVCEVVF
jgi:hypothetical protein